MAKATQEKDHYCIILVVAVVVVQFYIIVIFMLSIHMQAAPCCPKHTWGA